MKPAIVENEATTAIVEFSQFESDLAEYKAKYDGVVYDFTDKKQEKRARSDRLAIGKTISKLDSVHKDIKAPLLEQVKLLDGERKRIKDALTDVQDGIKQQIAEHEAKMQAIEDALLARVQELVEFAIFPAAPTSAEIAERIHALSAIEVDETFSHRESDAEQAKGATLEKLATMLVDTKKQEAQQAENDRLKAELAAKEQQERDERIAREAAAESERKAQAAELREQQAKADAEIAKVAAAKAAEDAAERVKEAEQRAADAQAQAQADAERRQQEEAQRLAEEQAAREADKEHRQSVNRAALDALVGLAGLTEEQGKAVVIAIANGLIPSVRINY